MNKKQKILHEMYRRSYAQSEPKGDWDELLKNADTNERGEKVIPFWDYYCDQPTMEQILIDVFKEYKVPKREWNMYKISFWLGCSPANVEYKNG